MLHIIQCHKDNRTGTQNKLLIFFLHYTYKNKLKISNIAVEFMYFNFILFVKNNPDIIKMCFQCSCDYL